MVSLDQFAEIAEGYAKNLQINADRLIKNATLSIVQNLVTATPIDVGTAESNWRVGVGSSPAGVIASWDPGTHGSTVSTVQHTTIDEARRVLAGYKFGTSLSIVNNTPYLARLNDGYSQQAPAGFVEEAFLKGLEQVKNAPNLLTRVLEES